MDNSKDFALYELWMYGAGKYHQELTNVNPFFVIDGEYQTTGMEILQ